MANYNNLKTAIQDVIKANGNREITGDILQNALLSMINSLGAGYQFIGVATPETNPSISDQKVFYVANGKGTYANFGGLIVDEDEVIILYYDTAWHKLLTGIASQAKLTELGQKIEENKVTVSRKNLKIGGEYKAALPDDDGESEEWAEVVVDSEMRIIEGTRKNGKKFFGGGVEGLEGGKIFPVSQLLTFERGNLTPNGKPAPISSFSITNVFRTPRYINAFISVKLDYSNPLITDVVLYQYGEDCALIKKGSVASNIDIQLESETVYIKVGVNSTVFPNIVLQGYSKSSSVEETFNERSSGDEISFGYEVTPNNGRDVYDDTTILQYTDTPYYGAGLLMLPPNYSQNGTPVRLVIFCHGSGDYQTRDALHFSENYQTYFHWLRDEGFAIMDCYNCSTKLDYKICAWGNSDNINCMVNAYNWVINNYNIRKDGVHLGCKSLGGIMALTLCFNRGIPVLSCGLLAPELSQVNQNGGALLGYSYEERLKFISDMQFQDVNGITSACLNNEGDVTEDEKTYVMGNIDKLLGFNPAICGMNKEDAVSATQFMLEHSASDYYGSSEMKKPRKVNVPIKTWVALDDWFFYISYAVTEGIKAGGSIAIFRAMPSNTGGHHAVDTDANALKVSNIVTSLGISYSNIPLAWVEMWQWFLQHD